VIDSMVNYAQTEPTGVRTMGEQEYVSVGVAADILGVTRQTIRRMIKRGDLPAEQTDLGDNRVSYRIKRSDLDNVKINPPHRPSSNKTDTN
jgi:excisionase family DNA binding protein